MAAPRNRLSNARKNSRSAHSALKAKNLSQCSNCGKTKMPHRICPYCGFYANRVMLSQETKEEK